MKSKITFLMVLCIVSLIAFSGATYAGFSKQYNPKVDGLQFTVATQENMMISTTGQAGTFKDSIPFSDLVEGEVNLNPVEGKITENTILLYDGANAANSNDYIKFSLYFSGSNDMDVYLEGSTSNTVVDPIEIQNSIFTSEQIDKMVDSLRIGFLAYSTRETPTGSGIEVNYDPISTHVYSVNEKTDVSYNNGVKPYETFTHTGYTSGILEDVILLSTHANKVSKMDIYIWLESKDVSCEESVFNALLRINLRFFAINNESGESSD